MQVRKPTAVRLLGAKSVPLRQTSASIRCAGAVTHASGTAAPQARLCLSVCDFRLQLIQEAASATANTSSRVHWVLRTSRALHVASRAEPRMSASANIRVACSCSARSAKKRRGVQGLAAPHDELKGRLGADGQRQVSQHGIRADRRAPRRGNGALHAPATGQRYGRAGHVVRRTCQQHRRVTGQRAQLPFRHAFCYITAACQQRQECTTEEGLQFVRVHEFVSSAT